MAVEASNWNLVILGAWNRAILTPTWLASTLFEIPEGSPISVELPLDFRGPWRLKSNELAVIVNNNGLEIGLDRPDYVLFTRACDIAIKAVASLPKTPVAAVGINFRYTAQGLPMELATLTECKFDASLSDGDFAINARTTQRAVDYKNGQINIDVTYKNDETNILFNFNLATNNTEEIINWLKEPIEELKIVNDKLLNLLQGDS